MIIENRSAALDLEPFHLGNLADAGPAVTFHFVVILEASQIGSHVSTSGLGGFLAGFISGSHVINTGHLLALGALVVTEVSGCNCSDCGQQEEFHYAMNYYTLRSFVVFKNDEKSINE